jgi:hypothetical protein
MVILIQFKMVDNCFSRRAALLEQQACKTRQGDCFELRGGTNIEEGAGFMSGL